MKTLYVSDMDGTLLNSEGKLSKFTVNALNKLIDGGAYFTVATARCMTSAVLLEPVHTKLMGIQLNGVLLYDFQSKKYVKSVPIEKQAAERIISIIQSYGRGFTMYYFNGGVNMVNTGFANEYEKTFFVSVTKNDYKSTVLAKAPITDIDGDIIYFTMVDEYERLVGIYNEVVRLDGVTAILYEDNYSHLYFLEIFSSNAGKEKAAVYLKNYYGADRLVAFGDNLNDITMLKEADYALVTANGNPTAKKYADEVIASNDDDGVVKFILDDYKPLSET